MNEFTLEIPDKNALSKEGSRPEKGDPALQLLPDPPSSP